jgi:glutathione peroxidase
MTDRDRRHQSAGVIAVLVIALSLTGTAVAASYKDADMSKALTKKPAGTVSSESTPTDPTPDYLQYPLETITGDTVTLADFSGNVVLLVNTASECGYTPQYKGLQDLYQRYRDSGLVVIGFPANNFGAQEPGSNQQIAQFCQKNFGVTFPLMSKISVLGSDKHSLFTYLTEASPVPGEIKWNFEKFLLDRKGRVAARYPSSVTPDNDQLVNMIETLLGSDAG